MDNLGDYIYLIILAVAGLSGLLKKKKVVPTASPTPGAPKQSSWEDFLEEVMPQEVEPKIPEKPIVQKVAPEPIQMVSYETTNDVSALRAKKQVSNMVSSQKIHTEVKVTTDNQVNDIRFSDVNDARRAFIYAEIFNRKY